MKKLIGSMLLFVVLANLGGFFVMFKIQEYAIKKEIKTRIKKGVSDDELHHFILTTDNQHQFEWKHSKEFKYKGMMYDVVHRVTLENGNILLKCVSDVQENELFKKLDEYISLSLINQNNGKHPIKQLHQFLDHLAAPTTKVYSLDFNSNKELSNTLWPNSYYLSPYLNGQPNPPEVLG